ncbi:hypothetical protein [Streptomyces chattanoogensis]|uniref:Uncharacterized protein n=1 Tax=Streptomyces chattanoogensis TaxID=66876 RepID=A0A0N1JWK9_9ACTN|nr:hypothetical protein [Streptomyces chattanoogensis]KPC60174.1 hypothetical protein ADL29_30975 [Streptomyces chattanoogensis]
MADSQWGPKREDVTDRIWIQSTVKKDGPQEVLIEIFDSKQRLWTTKLTQSQPVDETTDDLTVDGEIVVNKGALFRLYIPTERRQGHLYYDMKISNPMGTHLHARTFRYWNLEGE